MIKKVTNKDIKNGSFVVPDGVTEIGNHAFDYCTSLKKIIIPEGVNEIGGWAFCRCKSLESIIIPEGVTKIGKMAFYGCKSLKKVSLPKKVKLGYSVFHRCHPHLKIEYRD